MKNVYQIRHLRRWYSVFALCFILISSLQVQAQVTVNPGGTNYASVNAAFAGINAGLHTGAVTIAINASTTEPTTPTTLAASGVGSANYSSVTIYPTVAGVSVAGTTAASRGVLEFNGADNITINGNLNNGTGTSRDLTIRNTTAITNAHTVLWFQSSATSPQLGCTNIVVKNTIIYGNADVSQTRTSTTPIQPAVSFSSNTFPTSVTSVTALNNSNITFDNNEVLRSVGGLHFGQSTTAALTGLVVTNNVIGSQTLADYTILRAIYAGNCSGALIQGNTIQNIRTTISSTAGAIEISGATGGNNTIRKNLIKGVSNTSSSGWGSAGIYIVSGSNMTIDNNVIYDLQGANYSSVTTTFNTYGIRLASGTGHKVWYNSVNLYGTISSGTSPSTSTAIAIGSTAVTGLDIRNNIFSNSQVSTVAGFQAYCIRFAASYPFTTAGNTINNNFYSVPSSNTATTSYFVGGTYTSGVTYANLGALQTATGYDASSLPLFNALAPFTANDNLVIPSGTVTGIESGGVAISGLGLPNTDFTGVNRPAGSGTAPDMGAYEFNGVPATGCNSAPSSGGTASAGSSIICAGGSTTLTATGFTSDIGITYQWVYSSVSGGPYTPLAGATNPSSANTGALSANTYFRLEVTCSNTSQMTPSNEILITVNNPQLTSTTPGSRCGVGTVNLAATSTTGIVNWYAAPSGGTPLFTGTNYTTPSIASTTTYYASAASSGTTQISNHGLPTVTTSTQNTGVLFTLNTDVTLNSIDVYSNAAGTVTVSLLNSALTTIYTSSPFPITSSGLSTPQTVPLGWAIPAGTNYRILVSNTGNSLGYHSGTFPINLGNGVGQVTNGATATGTSTLNYFVYNMNTTSGCQGPRTAVTATINTAPSISASTSIASICSGNSATLSATSSNASYDYTWNPGGLTGGSVNVSPTSTTVYTVTGTDNSGGTFNGCQEVASVTVTVIPASVSVVGNPEAICSSSGSTILSLNPASGYPAGSIQWQDSPDGITYTNISGANANTFTTPTLTAYQYYRAVIVDANNNVCVQPSKLINVGIPTVNSTTPASRCGSGTVTLGASTSFGSNAIWYSGATGGSPIATGSSYTTPYLNTSTTYYVAANTGGTSVTTGRLTPQAGAATVLTTYGQDFTITQSITLNSVQVISTTGTSITVSLFNAGGATQLFTTGAVVVPTNTTNTINLGWSLAPGTYRLIANGMTGNFIRENSTVTYPIALSTVGQVNGFVSSITGTVTTTASYYWFYSWNITIGCESARVPVTATVTPGPSITAASTDLTLCPGSSADLSVTSPNDPNFQYTWSSSPAGFTATGPGPHTVTPSVTTKYYVVAVDTSTGANAGCGAVDSITVVNTGTLTAGTISGSLDQLCVTGNVDFTLAGANGGVNQWQMSTVSSSGPWTNVGTGANTYNTGTITQTTFYRVETSCDANVVYSNVDSVIVNNPTVLSTTAASRCGYGTVTLGATGSSSTLNWYGSNSPTDYTVLGTGSSFVTPNINSTTTFYVAASDGGATYGLGLPNRVGATTNSGYSDIGLMFDATQAFLLQSVAIYPVATTPSGNVTATIALKNSAGTILQSVTVSVPTSASPGIKTLIPLNFIVPAGSQHRLVFTSATGGGISGFIREATTGYAYPYTIPGVASITSAYTSGASSAYYYYFYDWKVVTGCESARVPVVATVTTPPAMSLTSTYPAVCTGGSTDIAVSSANDPNYVYTWTSNPAGFSQSGNGPFTVSPTSTTSYIVQAVDTSSGSTGGCVNRDSVVIVAGGTLSAGVLSASQTNLCVNGNSTTVLSVVGASGGLIQWQSAPSSTGPWTTVQTGGLSYTSPSLTQDTYYQVVVSCSNSSLTSNQIWVQVSNPTILSSTGATRCGTGTVTLSASSASPTINWYANASGGTALGTGSSFTTPVISNTTTFYVSAASGTTTSQISSNGLPTVTTSTQNTGLLFDLNVPVTLNSIDVYSNAVGTATVTILNSALTTIYTSPAIPISNLGLTSPQTLSLGVTIPAGTGYRILVSNTGNALGYHTGTFPIPLGNGVGTITSGATATGTTTLNYFVYSMNTSVGCESSRIPVIATVTPAPSISLGSDVTICNGQ
ncbi:MAG: hypothetical protein U0Y08_12620, partial [Bacteroidia bacterium]